MPDDSTLFSPSLEQQIDGVCYGKYRLGDNLVYSLIQLEDLVALICETGLATMPIVENHPAPNLGIGFQNKVFELYVRGKAPRCTCFDEPTDDHPDDVLAHNPDCPQARPNFRCGDLQIWWFRCIGQAMSANQLISRTELRQVFRRCQDSLMPMTSAGPKPPT